MGTVRNGHPTGGYADLLPAARAHLANAGGRVAALELERLGGMPRWTPRTPLTAHDLWLRRWGIERALLLMEQERVAKRGAS